MPDPGATFQDGDLGTLTSRLPFFVPLPLFYKTGHTLFDFLLTPIREKTNVHAKNFLQRILSNGHAILLLDSLDEVPKSERPELLSKVKAFCGRFPNASVVISCRTADYTDVLDSFYEVEIAKLDRPAVHKIVKAWFSAERQKSIDLCSIIDNDKGIASLTETPLLLSLLCIQFRHDLLLPKRKVELFKRCSETLLRDWDTTGPYLSLPIKKKAINHLIDSQIEIARIYGGGGVFPISQLLEDGIGHPFFWTSKRPTLSTALQPFRKLSNEILKTPISGYADAVFEVLPNLSSRIPQSHPLLYDALLINLVTPLAKTHGSQVHKVLRQIVQGKPNAAITKFVEVTLKAISANNSAM